MLFLGVQYLEFLKEEIEILLAELNSYVARLNTTDLQNTAAILPTAFWDALQPGGELPQILNPDLLKWLTGFYQSVRTMQRGFDLIIETWSISECGPADGVVKLTLQGVEKALLYRCLPEKIDLEIREIEKYKGQLQAKDAKRPFRKRGIH